MVPLSYYLAVAACLFALGIIGLFLNRKNVIVILMCIELILLAVNVNLAAFSHFLQDLGGQIFIFFVLTVAASEVAVGLAILVAFYRNRRSINVEDINTLQG
ncbi:MAG: NADH-quinone oxidoreductase subunit NuoK [Zetaproteobacteria bacterium CG06_land_8_20_14_3_00_59_53]|nr:MAG: NADH-quinone oxidoreductase subunit K [Zetaproteobacteria bacterium CG2_30_59_37]PIO90257.1 MAG: NADH-quinone oxidoreductase subunit NuoK [Zetaproteobacteria bacterium CG23_combo_of_CG06-09_8_20_14_all_59_86]PIQ64603.1 MAG: NADH-quinone oxidoreductase subunit NuoK [Zetaproteobacteria bacterium CG11_big_fil_rev_8_21_14_0_20_59_439]PIU71303.1 MAG: NADH-quinone oxidoreductase subunit NuoK [Zetaproteobacteria bacterium CG06_land_8_20_14_3_00_59_53]PIU97239.1 MAG: NADH-quinone oxidoreductase